MLHDAIDRAQATDPSRSFIVQAPAGSGKTEILTQRYLRLLSTVNAPEQIIALTFTRKAANEMRERVLLALQQASLGVPATSEHKAQTYRYANDALTKDQALNWQLLQQPGKLRILTIDALCQIITTAIPLQEKQIPYAHITDKPYNHYLTAATACLSFAIEQDSYHPAIKTLLMHLDNRQDKLLSLFSSLLATRDQWLPSLYQGIAQDKALYEQALSLIEQHELTRLQESIPKPLADELTHLARLLAEIEANPASIRYPLRDLMSFTELNGQLATSLCALVLTSTNTLRKSFDHHVGLRRDSCDKHTYEQLKSASKKLLSTLEELPDFLAALLRVKNLPDPDYDPQQWLVLQALFSLLPVLVAHLHLVFSEHNEVDFTAIALQALDALGEEETPTDLALYLDNRIHHLLIDEFQDTSIQQFDLLSRLVQGFQPNDGKTVFVVGDPMQSIYRFRAAEVGLFLRARQHGIGGVTLTPLALSCNFRSTPTLIDWINYHFKTIFPEKNDIESGAISFHPAHSTQSVDALSFVKAYQFENSEQEAQGLVSVVANELESHPSASIAILVRSRHQLSKIMRVLKEQHIPFQGVDIDLLANLPHLRDVWSLTQALLMPSNRQVWLSVLRSPWCGLSLADLLVIANVAKHQSILVALAQTEHLAPLSDEGRARAQYLYKALSQALSTRHQHALVDWLRHTLQQLHMHQILDTAQLQDLEQYWLLLDQFEKEGQLRDLSQFKLEFNKLYSKQVTPSRLQIMTIHKSKGLEFDCVILPGLSGKSRNTETPLLRFLKIPTDLHGELLLVSPIKAANQDHCALYDYLNKLDAEKGAYEQQRLLYVAATRAKKRLYLFDNHYKSSQGTFRSLLHQQPFMGETEKAASTEAVQALPILMCLPTDFYKTCPKVPPASFSSVSINQNHTPRMIGIVAHALLQWICTQHPETLLEIPWEMAQRQLIAFGLTNTELQEAHALLKRQITQLFSDPVGQWIIKRHVDERNEYECLVEQEGEVVTRIIDRTFCEQGNRWIIDFKTGHEDIDVTDKHRHQLNEYAQIFLNQSNLAIRCGLYYLDTGHWVEWAYQA